MNATTLIKFPSSLAWRLGGDELPARDRVDNLLSRPDAPEAVAEMSPVELYDLVRDVGLADAHELVALATPEQLQTFADLDVWQRESFVASHFEEWLELYLQRDDQAFEQLWYELDPELIPLYLQERITVWTNDVNEPAPDPGEEDPRPLQLSPDGTFWIQYPIDEVEGELARALIARIYDVLGVSKGWLTFEGVRWEMRSMMEERAYHFRKSRLEELGFSATEDAVAIYSATEPAMLRAKAMELTMVEPITTSIAGFVRMRGPARTAVVEVSDEEATFLGRCLAQLDEPGWTLVEPQLVVLVNMAASADALEPRDRSALAPLFARVSETLNVGLEYLTDRDEERAAIVLRGMPIAQIFAAGYGLGLELQQTARLLVADPRLTLTDAQASGLGDNERDLLEGLLMRRPLRSATTRAHFASHAEISEAVATLAGISFQVQLIFGLLGFSRDELVELAYGDGLAMGPEEVGFENLFATVVLRAHLSGEPSLEPFQAGALPRDEESVRAAFADWRARRFLDAQSTTPVLLQSARAFVQRVEERVVDDVCGGRGEIDPRFVRAVLLADTES